MLRSCLSWGLSAAIFASGAASASAAIVGITVSDASTGNYTLTSVTLNRGAATPTYTPGQFIGVDVTGWQSIADPILTGRGQGLPATGSRAALLDGDWRVDTGLLNPFSTPGPDENTVKPAYVAGVQFQQAVVNSDGPDIVFFELGVGDPVDITINSTSKTYASGSGGGWTQNLITSMPFDRYQSPGGDVLSLSQLESRSDFLLAENTNTSSVAGLPIDLSDFGIPVGGTASFLSWDANTSSRVDAVVIAGLPAVPEPGALALLSVGGLVALRRRR
jgi:hypothetical protein